MADAINIRGAGDLNLFKLFIEARPLALSAQGGQFSLLVPSGFQTDEGCGRLRRWLLTEHRFDELTSFENRGYAVIEDGKEKTKHIFPDVDSRFKFGFFKVVKGVTASPEIYIRRSVLSSRSEGRLRAADSLQRRNAATLLARILSVSWNFVPRKITQLATRIRGEHQLLGDLGYQFRRELHPD